MDPTDLGIDINGKHKYVWTYENGPTIGGYTAPIPIGWMTDGATCVRDLKVDNFFWHDWGYSVGLFIKNGKEVRPNKWTLDRLYGKASGDVVWWRGKTRFFGLALFPPTAIPSYLMWRKARKRVGRIGTDAVIKQDMIPDTNRWKFTTDYTKDAIWLPLSG